MHTPMGTSARPPPTGTAPRERRNRTGLPLPAASEAAQGGTCTRRREGTSKHARLHWPSHRAVGTRRTPHRLAPARGQQGRAGGGAPARGGAKARQSATAPIAAGARERRWTWPTTPAQPEVCVSGDIARKHRTSTVRARATAAMRGKQAARRWGSGPYPREREWRPSLTAGTPDVPHAAAWPRDTQASSHTTPQYPITRAKHRGRWTPCA